MIQTIKTVGEYDVFTQREGIVVVHFGFNWNSFDRTMQRSLVELKPEFGEKAFFGYVDADKNATLDLVVRINLVNTPTLVYFKNGEQQFVQVGMRPQDEVRQNIQALLD